MTASPSNTNSQVQIGKIKNLMPIQRSQGERTLRLVEPQGQVHVHMASYRGSFPNVFSEALRAAGLGSKVVIAQFLKGGVHQGPSAGVSLCGGLTTWIRPNIPFYLGHTDSQSTQDSSQFLEAKMAINSVWETCKEGLKTNGLQKLVLDEIGLAIQLGFLEEEELISALEERINSIDVILTGSSIPPKVIAMADQLTELRCSK